MKILHITSGLSTGGAERMLVRLLKSHPQNNFVISLTSDGSQAEYIRQLGIPVYSAELSLSLKMPIKIASFFRKASSFRPDLVVGWMYHGNLAASFTGMLLKAPVIWNIRHSLHSIKFEKRLLRIIISISTRLSSSVKKIIYNSVVAAKQHEELGYNSGLRSIIPNGVDTEIFKPDENARASAFDELKMPKNSFVIGHIARYHPMKDHATFLKSAKLILQSIPTAQFILIGPGVNNLNSELEKLIMELNLNKAIHLLGERSDIQHWAAAFDIFVSSSSWGEGFSNVIAECMACGAPAITTNIGDAKYIVGETGTVIQPSDEVAMSTAVIKLFNLGISELRSLGLAARKRICENFLIQDTAQKFRQLYETTVSPVRR